MIEALPKRRGYLAFEDGNGKRHTASVFSMGTPKEAGPGTTYLTFTNYRSLFVRSSIEEVQAAMRRARTLRAAQIATAGRAQLEFNFTEKETAVQLPTETAAANTHQADEAHNGGS